MMISIWTIVRFLHVLSAIAWVGGQLTLSLIVRRAAMEELDEPESRTALFAAAGRRFARVSTLGLMPVLVATGIALAWHRGVDFGGLTRPGYAGVLGVKILLAFVSLGLAVLHGVTAARQPGTGRAIGLAGVAVSVTVVLLATALVP